MERDNYIPVPSFHFDILNLYENNDRLQAILAPVGFAKSTTLRSFALKNLLDDTKFQLYVSSSASKITQHFCMTSRGVEKQKAKMITSSLEGVFYTEILARNELLQLVK